MKPYSILIFLLFTQLLFGQSQSDIIIGNKYDFNSNELNSSIEIQVYEPQDQGKKDLLVLLDGQRLFTHGISLSQTFKQFNLSPDLLVVGITTPYPKRFKLFSSEAEVFKVFITNQLIPFLEDSFNISDKRTLFGWEYGGSFVVKTFFSTPELFDSYIAASPFPTEPLIKDLDTLISSKSSLFFTVEDELGIVADGTESLNNFLMKADPQLNWKYNKQENEEHRSTPYSTLYHGLRDYYSHYPEIQFNTLDEFNNSGGLDFVYNYYKKRAQEYSFSPEPTPWTMFSIIRTAMRADNYEQFDALFKEFESSGFLSKIRISRAISIGDFYYQNKQINRCIDILTQLSERHVNSVLPLKRLGDIYKEIGDESKSLHYYQKANLIEERSN